MTKIRGFWGTYHLRSRQVKLFNDPGSLLSYWMNSKLHRNILNIHKRVRNGTWGWSISNQIYSSMLSSLLHKYRIVSTSRTLKPPKSLTNTYRKYHWDTEAKPHNTANRFPPKRHTFSTKTELPYVSFLKLNQCKGTATLCGILW